MMLSAASIKARPSLGFNWRKSIRSRRPANDAGVRYLLASPASISTLDHSPALMSGPAVVPRKFQPFPVLLDAPSGPVLLLNPETHRVSIWIAASREPQAVSPRPKAAGLQVIDVAACRAERTVEAEVIIWIRVPCILRLSHESGQEEKRPWRER